MLTADLKVNGTNIGSIYARRLSPIKPNSDTICKYEWSCRIINRKTIYSKDPLEHRYGDGAWALIAKIIQEVTGN